MNLSSHYWAINNKEGKFSTTWMDSFHDEICRVHKNFMVSDISLILISFLWYPAGLFPVLVISILLAIESTRATGKVLDWIFIVILPNYNMGQGIGNIYNNYEYLNLCFNKFPEAFGLDKGKESLDDICELLDDAGSEFPCCKG